MIITKNLQGSLQLPIYHHCIPSRYYLLPTLPKLFTAYYLLPTTYYRLPPTYHLPATYYLPPTICYNFLHTDNLKQSFDTHWIGLLEQLAHLNAKDNTCVLCLADLSGTSYHL